MPAATVSQLESCFDDPAGGPLVGAGLGLGALAFAPVHA